MCLALLLALFCEIQQIIKAERQQSFPITYPFVSTAALAMS